MILNKDAAQSLVIKHLKKNNIQILNVTKVNMGKHVIFKKENQNFYLLYKREALHSFKNLHQEYTNKPNSHRGYGETINQEYLKYALRLDALLLYVYESDPFNKKEEDKIYYIHPKAIKSFCEDNKLIRRHEKPTSEQIPKSQSIQTMYETTYDFPIQLLQRFN